MKAPLRAPPFCQCSRTAFDTYYVGPYVAVSGRKAQGGYTGKPTEEKGRNGLSESLRQDFAEFCGRALRKAHTELLVGLGGGQGHL